MQMTKAQILASMFEAAAPVIKTYWTDIRHDARLIADAPDTSAFLWAPVECGTRIVLLSRGERPNARAAEMFAVLGRDVAQWYYICADMGDFAPVSKEDAETSALGATERAKDGDHVSEIHM